MRFFTRKEVMGYRLRDTGYRIWSWFRHQLTSWNTGGEGIHSPYLFHLVRMIISDDNRYYCWDDIEERREAMLHAPKLVRVKDYGSRGKGREEQRLVSDIARTSLQSAKNAQVLFRIVTWLGHEKGEPLHMVELGTSLGITTAYLAKVDSRNTVETYEGSQALIELAERNWKKLGIENVQVVEGNIDDTLYIYNRKKPIDFGYIDANHTYEATLRYFEALAQRKHEKTIIALDDIHYNEEMERAWKEIGERSDVTSTMDFYGFGLVFFDTHYLKRHYRLRI